MGGRGEQFWGNGLSTVIQGRTREAGPDDRGLQMHASLVSGLSGMRFRALEQLRLLHGGSTCGSSWALGSLPCEMIL